MLAQHRDTQTSSLLPVEQVAASGFHCQIDDLVVVAPFVSDLQLTVSGLVSSTRITFSEPVNTFFPAYTSHTDGRGPPAHFCV